METKKAFFTPSPETLPQIVARMLFADDGDRPTIAFFVDDPNGVSDLPHLSEITLNPVHEICITRAGAKITGRNIGTDVVGCLGVDITADWPIATYTEPST